MQPAFHHITGVPGSSGSGLFGVVVDDTGYFYNTPDVPPNDDVLWTIPPANTPAYPTYPANESWYYEDESDAVDKINEYTSSTSITTVGDDWGMIYDLGFFSETYEFTLLSERGYLTGGSNPSEQVASSSSECLSYCVSNPGTPVYLYINPSLATTYNPGVVYRDFALQRPATGAHIGFGTPVLVITYVEA